MLYATPRQTDPRLYTYFFDEHTEVYKVKPDADKFDLEDLIKVVQNHRTNCASFNKVTRSFVAHPVMGSAPMYSGTSTPCLFYTKYTNFAEIPNFTSMYWAKRTILPVGTTNDYGRGRAPVTWTDYGNNPIFAYKSTTMVNKQGPIHPVPPVFRGVTTGYTSAVSFPYIYCTMTNVWFEGTMNMNCNYYGRSGYSSNYNGFITITSGGTSSSQTSLYFGALVPKDMLMFSYGMELWSYQSGPNQRITNVAYSYGGIRGTANSRGDNGLPVESVIDLTSAICLVEEGARVRAIFMEKGEDYTTGTASVGAQVGGNFLSDLPKLYLDAPLAL